MPRLPPAPQPAQAIAFGKASSPEQCAPGGPATPADGYYSVLCRNCTGTLPNPTLHLLTYSAVGWHACNHQKRGPCIVLHQHTRSTSDAQQNLCRRRAGRHWGGSQGVLLGYSAAERRACNKQSGSCNNHCVHAAWHLHPSAMRLRDGISQSILTSVLAATEHQR
jgi:hypothetical protein